MFETFWLDVPDSWLGRRRELAGPWGARRRSGAAKDVRQRFIIPHYPQTILEEAGAIYARVAPDDPLVVRDGNLVTGQKQESSSEQALVLLHAMTGKSRWGDAAPASPPHFPRPGASSLERGVRCQG
jgi:hypothetical protein